MGLGDKISNTAKEATGKVKEGLGNVTNNADLKADGLKDQSVAKGAQIVEKIKDAVKDARKN